jgi:thymidine kinase
LINSVELIIGPMFAGKTTGLINRVAHAELANQRCLVLKYSRDVRYSRSNMATHNPRFRAAVLCDHLLPNLPRAPKCDVVAIDGAQFFPDRVEFCAALVMRRKRVLVAGLDGTFQRQPFGRVADLIPLCASVDKPTAVCRETGEAAAFSHRKTSATEVELIGGNDRYAASCRAVMVGRRTASDISLILGPRGAGKTAKLRREVGDGSIYRSKLLTVEELGDCSRVGADDAEDVEGVCEWAETIANAGKRVVVAALDCAANGWMPREILDLVPRSERVAKPGLRCQLDLSGRGAPDTVRVNPSYDRICRGTYCEGARSSALNSSPRG